MERDRNDMRSVVYTGRDSEQRLGPSAGVWKAGANQVRHLPLVTPLKLVISAELSLTSSPGRHLEPKAAGHREPGHLLEGG